jgi:hypothetical protein
MWERYYDAASAIIFVVDSYDTSRLEEGRLAYEAICDQVRWSCNSFSVFFHFTGHFTPFLPLFSSFFWFHLTHHFLLFLYTFLLFPPLSSSQIGPMGVPISIFANKQDINGSLSPGTATTS